MATRQQEDLLVFLLALSMPTAITNRSLFSWHPTLMALTQDGPDLPGRTYGRHYSEAVPRLGWP